MTPMQRDSAAERREYVYVMFNWYMARDQSAKSFSLYVQFKRVTRD